MYAGKCKHGVIVAGCVDPDLDLDHMNFSDVVKEAIDFGHFVKQMLDEGLTVNKQDSITLQECVICKQKINPESYGQQPDLKQHE